MALPRRMKITLNLPYLIGRKFFKKQVEDGYEDKPVEDYIAYLLRAVTLRPTEGEMIQASNEALLEMWMQNFADNLPHIRFGNKLEMKVDGFESNNLSELAEPEPTDAQPPKGSAIVIGRGPSLFKKNHLELLAKSGYAGKICASDGILIDCLKQGIIPDLTTTVDGSTLIKKWYDHDLVREYGPKLNVALNATTNHEVYEILQSANCKIFWFYPMFDDYRDILSWTKMQRLMTKSKYQKKPLQAVMSGGNTGTCSWAMAISLFKRANVALIGIDFGYPEGTKLVDTPYYSGIMQSTNNNPAAIPQAYKQVFHPTFKTIAYIDSVFWHYRESFLSLLYRAPLWHHQYGGSINCSEGGTLFGPHLRCMPFAEFLSKHHK